MARLAGKVAVITGGAGGIGIEAGRCLLRKERKSSLVDLSEEPLRQAVSTLEAKQSVMLWLMSPNRSKHSSMCRTAVERYGGIDIYLANAGIEGTVQPITDYPLEIFDKVLAVNVRGVWLGLKYVIPEMKNRGGGSIIITSSVAGIKGTPGVSAYVTSKHAVIGMMRTAALESATVQHSCQYSQSSADRNPYDAFAGRRFCARCGSSGKGKLLELGAIQALWDTRRSCADDALPRQ